MKANIKDGKKIPAKGNYRKLFECTFKELTYKHNAWQVWQDFVFTSALSISNAVDKREEIWQKREDEYLSIVKKYSKSELELLPKLLGYTTMALDTNPNQDFLGQLYMDLDFGRDWQGQFFTPWNIAEMMARMQIDNNIIEKIIDGGYFSVADPCCGAGVMLLAFAQAVKFDYAINYQESVLFVAQDIDPVVAKMAYIQMSLLGLPGYVAIGDSLAKPIVGTSLIPDYDADKLWFTPMFYSMHWCFRRLICSDKTISYHPARGNGKSRLEADSFKNAVINPQPKANKILKTSEKEISLAKKELSKLEQQKSSFKKIIKLGKEKLRGEISKNKSESNKKS